MNALLQAALEVQEFLRSASEKFCFIGGVAVQRWGEPRFTRDIDITLLCPYGTEAMTTSKIVARFPPRMPDAGPFAIQHRVLLVQSTSGVPIDIALGAIPFEERCVARATEFDFGGAKLVTCSAEDLVVLKAFAARDRDWADIESVMARRLRQLDWSLIIEELTPLAALREDSRIISRLNELRSRFSP